MEASRPTAKQVEKPAAEQVAEPLAAAPTSLHQPTAEPEEELAAREHAAEPVESERAAETVRKAITHMMVTIRTVETGLRAVEPEVRGPAVETARKAEEQAVQLRAAETARKAEPAVGRHGVILQTELLAATVGPAKRQVAPQNGQPKNAKDRPPVYPHRKNGIHLLKNVK
ncbi:hypothetical protein [Paenibacillus rubinfantis]|uniref:hypothetical protein n=1 Tax=Paenibacillus rubinfantis TaxID=1720296 RepID=UPI0011DDB6A6|nr:hypothetical protein [Paenibacillus rubinfantis]